MLTLQWLAQQLVQIVGQTATMPPSLTAELFTSMGVTTYTVCREPTARNNICYRVIRVPTADMPQTLLDLYSRAKSAPSPNLVLIFCRSQADAHAVANQLNIPVCHAGMPPGSMDRLLQDFRQGTVPALATTSILGVSLDIAAVTYVFHYGYPHNALSFLQEAGRGGRHVLAQQAWSVVIAPTDANPPRYPDNDRFGERLVHDSIEDSSTCRRLVLQWFIDGDALPCAMLGGKTHMCDNCLARSQNHPHLQESSEYPLQLIKARIAGKFRRSSWPLP